MTIQVKISTLNVKRYGNTCLNILYDLKPKSLNSKFTYNMLVFFEA